MTPAPASSQPADASDAAIARVLLAEAQARAAIAATQLQVQAIAEDARRASAALALRTERRLRAVAAAFEHDTEGALAEIEATGAGLSQLQPPSAGELVALEEAVQRLARELIAP